MRYAIKVKEDQLFQTQSNITEIKRISSGLLMWKRCDLRKENFFLKDENEGLERD